MNKFCSVAFFALFAFAALAFGEDGGIEQVNALFEKISSALKAVGSVILTISVMWAGYKVMFQGKTMQEVAPLFLGGVLVGAASYIASYLLPST